MNINNIVQALHDSLGRSAQSLFVRGDAAFTNTLTVGQIIKGKVMRHYEGDRYLVNFSGQEKVVDSAVPLRTGELIHGRVLGLGEQVHLQRVRGEGGSTASPDTPVSGNRHADLGSNERLLVELFERFQAKLPPNYRTSLMQAMARSPKPDLMALSGLLLSKIGVSMAPEFLRAVFKVLKTERMGDLHVQERGPSLALAPTAPGLNASDTIEALAGALQGLLQASEQDGVQHLEDDVDAQDGPDDEVMPQEADTKDRDEGASDEQRERWLGAWLLNAQSEGTVAHHVTRFPIWFGERLIEVNMALFSQREGHAPRGEIKHRRIVFSLDTDTLGHVEISAGLANRNLRLEVTSERDSVAEAMAAYIGELRQTLDDLGWNVEAIHYRVAEPESGGGVVRSVVEHYITQDSVNQLV